METGHFNALRAVSVPHRGVSPCLKTSNHGLIIFMATECRLMGKKCVPYKEPRNTQFAQSGVERNKLGLGGRMTDTPLAL